MTEHRNVISIHRAKIKTMSVSVKALTLNDRQVTLSAFRQLKEEDLIKHDGTLNGVPWGTVNYCPDKRCGRDRDEHWHIVWQKGDELRRDTIDPPDSDWYEARELDVLDIQEIAELFVEALVCEVYDGVLVHKLPKILSKRHMYGHTNSVPIGGRRYPGCS